MQTNNAETQTQETATATDSKGTTNVIAIEEGKTSTANAGVESKQQSTTDSDLFYEIDGEEVSASTVAEWRKGHMLQSDYTKKSQANAEKAKAIEAKAAELNETKTKLSDIISELDSVISKGKTPQELAELRDSDPSEYLRYKEEIAQRKELSEKAKKELAAIKSREDAERITNEKNKLLEALPEWLDPVKQKADVQLIDDYAASRGFSNDDFNVISSHKMMLMALDAAKYHALKKETESTSKEVEKAPNVIKAKAKSEQKLTTVAQRFYGK
jgi:hypothetical protein